MLRWVLLVVFFLGPKTAQVVQSSTDPFECCSKRHNEEDLMTCVQEATSPSLISPTSNVLIVTYLTSGRGQFGVPDIFKFGVYQLAVMQAYSRVKGYIFHPVIKELVDTSVMEDSGDVAMRTDERWTKIDILRNITEDEQFSKIELILWIDADALVIDFSDFDVQKLAADAPHADILASADIRQGYINTGVLLIRNNAWSRWFLNEWWSKYDRTVFCDQDAFDLLYTKYINADEVDTLSREEKLSKVKIFPPSVLNSDPPAMKFQSDSDPILHLMGEASELRMAVFQSAYDNVCGVISETTSVYTFPKQLNQSRENLVAAAEKVYSRLSNQLYFSIDRDNALLKDEVSKDIDGFLSDPQTGRLMSEDTLNQFDEISVYYHHLCDVIAIIYKGQPSSRRERQQRVRIKSLELVKSRLDSIKNLQSELLKKKSSHEKEYKAVSYLRIMLMKRAAEAGNDLYHAHSIVEKKMEVAAYVLSTLHELHGLVASQSKPQILHMVALMHLSLSHLDMSIAQSKGLNLDDGVIDIVGTARKSPDTSNIMNAIEHAFTSIAIFDTHLNNSQYNLENPAVGREHLEALELHALLLCTVGRYHDSEKAWRKAVDKAKHNLKGVDLGLAFREYVHVNYNYMICTHKAISSSLITCSSSILRGARDLIISTEHAFERLTNNDQSKESLVLLQKIPDFQNMAEDIGRYLNRCISSGGDMENENTQRDNFHGVSNVELELFPSEEWEDCVEGEPGCEAYVIDEVQKTVISEERTDKAPERSKIYDEVTDDEDEEENRLIRMQYMEQTKDFQGTSNHDVSDVHENRREQIALLQQKIEEQRRRLEADKLELERLEKLVVSI